ncbi:hypothetical protein [Cellulomonas bogoriensis]|uniref:LigA n=1 Tax=Cellulomonas bogoriensis 69B4 = DSM 16987 TaxID=1386082 RepID=A0A0A0BND8_9CELL|nr:hypothetical protein [Cellulomonas bogoriensis]KGM09481.1 LigA [Cellulomonas bogoriensis 69B4 = DSM 16987]
MTTTTVSALKRVRLLGLITLLAGAMLLVAGTATTLLVRDQLASENIIVHDDSPMFAGNVVDGPIDAFLQAEVIRGHALDASGGLTYSELDREDPVRETLQTASFLRASLLTSVISFGVAALVAGLGVLFILIGFALRSVGALAHEAEVSTDRRPVTDKVPVNA